MSFLKNEKTKQFLCVLTTVLLILHPVIELDYLLPESWPLPRLTTLIDLIVLPLLVILTFLCFEQRKKRVLLCFIPYAVLFGIYFLLHCRQANELQYQLFLPDNFVFLLKDEIVYTLALLLPLVYVYVFALQGYGEEVLKKITVSLSCLTAVPIFLSNLFVFGRSTYQGYTIANFFSWFSLPFNDNEFHPRKYASKFFFEEGNTIGVLLIITLPLLYYFFIRSEKKNEKITLGSLIAVHSLSMIILSTRVATYGTVLVPAALFVIYIILFVLKYEKIRKSYLIFLLVMTVACGAIIPFGPAYQNQQIDAMDYGYLVVHENDRKSGRESVKRAGEGLVKYSKEWYDFYTYVFEDNLFLIGVTPPIYYTEWYDYHHDPQFWVDLMFDYDLEERVSGRQIENIFTRYKFDPLPTQQKLLGMGYGIYYNSKRAFCFLS